MNKLHFVLGLLCFSLSIGWISGQDKPKFTFSLESVVEVDSSSTATNLCLVVSIKNTSAEMLPYPTLRIAVNDTVLVEPELTTYVLLAGATQEFTAVVPRLKKGQTQYRLIVESHESTINDKAEFAYKPKPYKAPKAKKAKAEKAKAEKAPKAKKAEVKKEISAPVEINSTPPSPPSN